MLSPRCTLLGRFGGEACMIQKRVCGLDPLARHEHRVVGLWSWLICRQQHVSLMQYFYGCSGQGLRASCV